MTLMFKWTSLAIKAVATVLLLHQTVANIYTASMGPVWHTFGQPSDRDPWFMLEHLTLTAVWTLLQHTTHKTLREILLLQEGLFVSQLVAPFFNPVWSSFGPHKRYLGLICQVSVWRCSGGVLFQDTAAPWSMGDCHCSPLHRGPVTARYVFICHDSHRNPKVFPVPRHSDVRPLLWTWCSKPQWVAIDHLKPPHLDQLSPHWGGQALFQPVASPPAPLLPLTLLW